LLRSEKGPCGSTALALAAHNGHLEAVRVLLEAGADPEARGGRRTTLWQTLMAHAWSASHRDVARLLLERGARCSFGEACLLSHLPTVRRMLAEDRALADRPDDRGVLPIVVAVLRLDVELARVLLEAGASDPKGQARALLDAAPRRQQSYARQVFAQCDFRAVNFHDVALPDATFSNVNLSGARFDNVNLQGASIDNANIRGMTVYGVEIAPLLARERARRAQQKDSA
jgi:ankyrin repeat protein